MVEIIIVTDLKKKSYAFNAVWAGGNIGDDAHKRLSQLCTSRISLLSSLPPLERSVPVH